MRPTTARKSAAIAVILFLLGALPQQVSAGADVSCRTVSRAYYDTLPRRQYRVTEFPEGFPWSIPIRRNRISAIRTIEGGWLIAENGGEFGGGVYRVNSSGLTVVVMDGEPVTGFIEDRRGLIAVIGQGHGVVSEGRLYRIVPPSNGEWSATHLTELPGEPKKFFADQDGRLWFITRILRNHDQFLECALEDAG